MTARERSVALWAIVVTCLGLLTLPQTAPSAAADPPGMTSDQSRPEPQSENAEGRRASEADPGKAQQSADGPPAIAPRDEAAQRREEARPQQPQPEAKSGYDLAVAGSLVAALFAGLAVVVYAYQAFLMRQTLIVANRAYVFLKGVGPFYLTDPDSDTKLWGWRFLGTWENSGNTPTRRMVAYATWVAFPGEMPADYGYEMRPDDPPGRTFIGPRHTMGTGNVEVPVSVLLEARDGRRSVYVWGWTEYSDVFRGTPRHRTEFCYRVVVNSDPRDKECVFIFRLHGAHNGADEECRRQPDPRHKLVARFQSKPAPP